MTEFLTIKRTELADVVVITAKRTAPNLVQPFTTFMIIGEGRYATRISDFATEAAALQAHHRLVVSSGERGSSKEDRAHATDAGPKADSDRKHTGRAGENSAQRT